MSFIITVYTNEGLIMASDSRTTYTTTRTVDGVVEKLIGVQTTDTTYKTFLCDSRIGISTCGASSINAKPIAGYIEYFISQKTHTSSTVEDTAQELLDYFCGIDPSLAAHFIVAGYDEDGAEQKIMRVFIDSRKIIPIDTSNAGAIWDGETDVVKRVVKDVALTNSDGSHAELASYSIGFNFFTLQDAVDFAKYAVDITIKTMAFRDCVKTVGGPIDILAIKPTGAFWIERKELHA